MPPTINQSSNQVSRRLGPMERTLKQKLLAFYNKRIKGSNAPIQVLRQRYGKEIEQIIRDNIQTSWLFATDIVLQRTNIKVDKVKDAQGIENAIVIMTNQFWETSKKNQEREQLSVIENGKLVQADEFDTSAAMLGVSGLMLYYAFNQSMNIKDGIRLLYKVRDDCIDTKICLPFNNKIFEVGLAPPMPQHRHCHCRLIPMST